MPDYNPDKERHVQHKFIVQKAWPGKGDLDPGPSIQTGAGEMRFDRQDRFMLSDPVVAREIMADHPRDLAVTRVRYPDVADRGHRYHFGQMPALPWHRYDEYGRRVDNLQQEMNNALAGDQAELQMQQEMNNAPDLAVKTLQEGDDEWQQDPDKQL